MIETIFGILEIVLYCTKMLAIGKKGLEGDTVMGGGQKEVAARQKRQAKGILLVHRGIRVPYFRQSYLCIVIISPISFKYGGDDRHFAIYDCDGATLLCAQENISAHTGDRGS